MRIVVDAMGGDRGCGVIVHGALKALGAQPGIESIALVGRREAIEPHLSGADSRIEILHAEEVLSMEDRPIDGIRRKRNCSIAKGVDRLLARRGDVFISPGNTGGVVTVSTIRLGRLPGVDRPGIATIIPTAHSPFVLLDSGANPDCKPEHLAQYAVMGSILSQEVLGRASPRVGLLSVGTEPGKGNALTLEAYRLCQPLDINFVGNIEGHDLFRGEVDVVVADGFVGNIVLKTCESLAGGLFRWIRTELRARPLRCLGAFLARGAFRKIRSRMDPDNYGGAHLLGIDGNVIIAHGSATARSIANAIGLAAQTVDHCVNQRIVQEIAKAEAPLAAPAASPIA